jgi:hypothetical protein
MKPSAWILFIGFVALAVSAFIWQGGDAAQATYVAIWAPSLFAVAAYFKTR